MSERLAMLALRFLPRNLVSRGFGWVARRRRPRWAVRRLTLFWARRFRIDLEEAGRPLETYASLLDFFTRELKAGARPVAADPEVLVSPVDGCVGAYGRVSDGMLVQAKGLGYSLAALLGSERAAGPFLRGAYATLYLSPRDYHRIHAPREGEIVRSLYEPGTLWPVNGAATRTIPSLFAINERVTTWIETDRGPIAVCMVGATNVGSIRLAYAGLVTNRGGARAVIEHDPPIPVARGDHIGTFELGSTVVLLVSDPAFEWTGIEEGRWAAMGSAIGRFLPRESAAGLPPAGRSQEVERRHEGAPADPRL